MYDVERFDQLARSQHGLVTSRQATEILGRTRKERWARQGLLRQVQPSVWRLAGAPDTWHQQLVALQLAANGRVSHRSSGEVWGLIRPRGLVEASVRSPRQPRTWAPGILHRIVDLDDSQTTLRDGLRLTDPVRTLVDLGLVLPAEAVEAAYHRGIRTGLFGYAEVLELRHQLGRCGRNGVGVIGEVLDRQLQEATATESSLETRLVRLIADAGLPLPSLQYEVWSGGRFVARIDAAFPTARVAIEVDGFRWHSDAEAFQRDRTRQNRLVALGWTVLRFTWGDIVRRGDEAIAAISAALRRATPADSECA